MRNTQALWTTGRFLGMTRAWRVAGDGYNEALRPQPSHEATAFVQNRRAYPSAFAPQSHLVFHGRRAVYTSSTRAVMPTIHRTYNDNNYLK